MADRVLTRDTVTGAVSATLDPAMLGGVGTRFYLPSPVVVNVSTDFQYLVEGALTIDPGASLVAAPGSQVVVFTIPVVVIPPTPLPPPIVWNAMGLLAGHFAQAGSFDTLLSSNAALAGDGPFDGQRVILEAATITNMQAIQRVPNTNPVNTQVEVYRIRAGTVTSLGVISGAMLTNFGTASQLPGIAGLQVGDILFVSFAAQSTDPTGADLTVYLELS